jgi:hypothetical protein
MLQGHPLEGARLAAPSPPGWGPGRTQSLSTTRDLTAEGTLTVWGAMTSRSVVGSWLWRTPMRP